MRYKVVLLILLAAFAAFAATARATDLRGRVDTRNPYTQTTVPFPGVGIALFATLQNGTFVIVRQTVTGPDGMYYFTGVLPGQYILQIGGVNYPLSVAAMPREDIPIIYR
jgi:hypothetical protein